MDGFKNQKEFKCVTSNDQMISFEKTNEQKKKNRKIRLFIARRVKHDDKSRELRM